MIAGIGGLLKVGRRRATARKMFRGVCGPSHMPMAVVEYGLTVSEHRATGRALPRIPRLSCPRCGGPTRSHGLVYRKRAEAWIRRVRCRGEDCGAVTALVPCWASVRVGATLPEVERVISAREAGATWRAAAAAAGLDDRPARHRSWMRRLTETFGAVMVLLPSLGLDHGGGWFAKLRRVLDITTPDPVVLLTLRWRLFVEHKVVLGPLGLLPLDRANARAPPSTSCAPYAATGLRRPLPHGAGNDRTDGEGRWTQRRGKRSRCFG